MSSTTILRGDEEQDFDWVYKLTNKDKEYLLGMIHPIELRDAFRKGEMLINEDKNAFCEIHFSPKRKHVTIYKIFVDPECRSTGVGRAFLDFIQENYEYPIVTTCIAETSSDSFWNHVGKLYEETTTRKGTRINRYMIGEPVKELKKSELF